MNPSATQVVLTIHPLSARYRARLASRLGSEVVCRTVADLRLQGSLAMIRGLMESQGRDFVVAHETAEGECTLAILCLLAMAHKWPRLRVADPEGNLRRIGVAEVLERIAGLAWASLEGMWIRRRSAARSRQILSLPRKVAAIANGPQRVLYLNNNLWFGLSAGGSIGHVAGVINGLTELGHEVEYVAPMPPGLLGPRVGINQYRLFRHFAVPAETNRARLHRLSVEASLAVAERYHPTVVYQRMSIGDWAGVEVARRLGIPLVVEYNGSEVWISKNWGANARGTAAMLMAEEVLLRQADLVFTISEPLRDELRQRGLDAHRVAWYPNCVDPATFDATGIRSASRLEARRRLGAEEGDIVVLFVGTFGMWHGAEVFAAAAARLATDQAWMKSQGVRFAFVGDGKSRATCENIIASSAARSRTVFTGLVPQSEAPAYLAAADAFVSPHVPNADGSRFFGSPTKLFEYMAMARPIVASRLDQIGEVLEDGRTALLVVPGDSQALADGIRRLVANPVAGMQLGAAARQEVLKKYTWVRHVEEILRAFSRVQ
ncbi:MAG TPA: glycosyltransferase family 4 protein [Candidatus Didemnitutus sp.]|nr:glycosyltransferase family 4 protein [Candidatus Didemnitutus sp.]